MTGTSSPGIKTPTTIVFFEVSIPRWFGPAADVTLDMTAGSLPPLWLRLLGSCTFQLPVTHDISQEGFDGHPEPAAS
jgi:hypothetical protein